MVDNIIQILGWLTWNIAWQNSKLLVQLVMIEFIPGKCFLEMVLLFCLQTINPYKMIVIKKEGLNDRALPFVQSTVRSR